MCEDISVALDLTTLIASLDSAANLADSSDPALDLLQILDATRMNNNATTKYYAARADLPIADSANEGMVVLVSDLTGANDERGLFVSTGTFWKELQGFEAGSSLTPRTNP